jgi:hypothetical protein
MSLARVRHCFVSGALTCSKSTVPPYAPAGISRGTIGCCRYAAADVWLVQCLAQILDSADIRAPRRAYGGIATAAAKAVNSCRRPPSQILRLQWPFRLHEGRGKICDRGSDNRQSSRPPAVAGLSSDSRRSTAISMHKGRPAQRGAAPGGAKLELRATQTGNGSLVTRKPKPNGEWRDHLQPSQTGVESHSCGDRIARPAEARTGSQPRLLSTR